jgi:hypothetical protein
MQGTSSWLRRSASLLVVLWFCLWLAPVAHQAHCAVHDHADTPCALCQLAVTSVISAPAQVAPLPVRILAYHLPMAWVTLPALLFQVEHPPRGPPPAITCV